MCLAIPGKIVELVSEDRDLAVVSIVGVRRKVDLGLLQEDRPVVGDWVLIHVGFAMSKISEADAVDQMRMLTELGEREAATQEARGYGLGDSEDARVEPGAHASDDQGETPRRDKDQPCDLSMSFASPR